MAKRHDGAIQSQLSLNDPLHCEVLEYINGGYKKAERIRELVLAGYRATILNQQTQPVSQPQAAPAAVAEPVKQEQPVESQPVELKPNATMDFEL